MPIPFSASYAWMRPSRSLAPLKYALEELRRDCIERRVWKLAMPSVGTPSSSSFEFTMVCPSGSCRERFRRYTPVKMTRNPQSRDMVLTASVVLNPLKRMKEAQRVAVVKVT